MPSHCWGDEWFKKHGNDLYKAISMIMHGWIKWGRIGTHGKEKYGTFRDQSYLYHGSWPIHELVKPGYVYYRWNKKFMNVELFLGRYLVAGSWVARAIRWYQAQVYNYFIQKACRMYPDIVDELVADLDGCELVKPGIFGKVCGKTIHEKYWKKV